ncbi:MAG: AGE family epimerase/isomerase [Planctomycetota bacterium]|jgi:N-acylglucosamine 2-epimerase
MKLDFRKLLDFYREHTYGNLMSYWMKHLDEENGGVFNCLSNRGDKLLHEHKFVWSQGRWAYTAARLYQDSEGEVPEAIRSGYLETARATTEFLMRHARLENGNCSFVLTKDGQPIVLDEDGGGRKARDGERYDSSMSADRFCLYGVAEYGRGAGDEKAYRWAKELHQHCERRISSGDTGSGGPYPTPKGYKTHGGPMGRVEDGKEMARAADRFGDEEFAVKMRDSARQGMTDVMELFVQPDGVILEMVGEDYKPVDTVLGHYCNPGHTLEDMWFILQLAKELDDEDVIGRAAEVTKATCEKAWDHEVGGGIPQFMDRETGYKPEGPVPPEIEGSVMVEKVRTLWDKKLWWPHSEALYTLLLVYELTEEPWALDWYQRFHDYTFATFPNEPEIGEWTQIRNRKGEPEDAVVALPVKDPMHIIRAFQHAINTLKLLIAAQ